MKHVLILPDSFKGTMSSEEVCDLMAKAVHAVFPECETTALPVADGGEGSTDAFLKALPGRLVRLSVCGPVPGEQVEGFYGLVHEGRTAVIELAAAAALPMVEDRKNPEKMTTYGVGQLMLAAAKSGAETVIIGLGGSATNDGGCGAAAACGVKFLDKAGKAFVPVGGTLKDIERIDLSGVDPAIRKVRFITMCDVTNPLCGPNGASAVFGPQKGATPEMVSRLDAGLFHLADIIKRDVGKEVRDLAGAGAAGGMGAGTVAFFDSQLKSGIETVLDAVHFDERLKDADMVFTGEGKIDGQSIQGKVISGISTHAKRQNVPVVAVVGTIDGDMSGMYGIGVTSVFSILNKPGVFAELSKHCKEDLYTTMVAICRLIGSQKYK